VQINACRDDPTTSRRAARARRHQSPDGARTIHELPHHGRWPRAPRLLSARHRSARPPTDIDKYHLGRSTWRTCVHLSSYVGVHGRSCLASPRIRISRRRGDGSTYARCPARRRGGRIDHAVSVAVAMRGLLLSMVVAVTIVAGIMPVGRRRQLRAVRTIEHP
jgi:hypothetical protein